MQDFPVHPAAEIFPEMDARTYEAFKANIAGRGLDDPIVIYQGCILDGRHRYRACRELGVTVRTITWVGDDPIAYVVAHNLHRRHLDESQRAMVAARIANFTHGGNRKTGSTDFKGPIGPLKEVGNLQAVTNEKAAEIMNVGTRSVKRARRVLEDGVPELVNAVDRGEVTVRAAEEVSKLEPEEQKEVLQKGESAVAELVNEGGDKTAAKRKPKKRSGNKHRGTHFSDEGEVDENVTALESLLGKWESMGGLRKMVLDWSDDKRWQFCDKLEELAKILRRWSTELRHHRRMGQR